MRRGGGRGENLFVANTFSPTPLRPKASVASVRRYAPDARRRPHATVTEPGLTGPTALTTVNLIEPDTHFERRFAELTTNCQRINDSGR